MTPFLRRVTALWAVLLGLAGISAQADETWTTDEGQLVWIETWGDLAGLEITNPNGTAVHIVVDSLGQNHDDRGVSTGIWYAVGNLGLADCPYSLHNPITRSEATSWGRIRLTFTHPRWDRADFVGLIGQCNDTPEERFDGTHN
ncbi:MAG: hypothetical protein AAGE13_04600 [Pseudomonadota bacterium]